MFGKAMMQGPMMMGNWTGPRDGKSQAMLGALGQNLTKMFGQAIAQGVGAGMKAGGIMGNFTMAQLEDLGKNMSMTKM